MSFEIKPATRQGIKPLIGLYGESGTGKTYSALLLARGFAGPGGKIVMVDTESGRGSLYAPKDGDAPLPVGPYDVLELREPFSPSRYIEAVQVVEESGAVVGVLDSGSHEWEGLGGVLDLAILNEEKSGKAGLHNWRGPKMEHAKFMLKLLQSPLPWIVCLRAKFKARQGKNAQGRTEIVKDETTSPIQAEDFIFEMTAHAEILRDHSINLTKCSHPSLRDCFPSKGPITIQHGEMLAKWCAAPFKSPAAPVPPADPITALKLKLWRVLAPVRGKEKWGAPEAEAWLRAKNILPADVTISQLTADGFQIVIDKTEIALDEAK